MQRHRWMWMSPHGLLSLLWDPRWQRHMYGGRRRWSRHGTGIELASRAAAAIAVAATCCMIGVGRAQGHVKRDLKCSGARVRLSTLPNPRAGAKTLKHFWEGRNGRSPAPYLVLLAVAAFPRPRFPLQAAAPGVLFPQRWKLELKCSFLPCCYCPRHSMAFIRSKCTGLLYIAHPITTTEMQSVNVDCFMSCCEDVVGSD